MLNVNLGIRLYPPTKPGVQSAKKRLLLIALKYYMLYLDLVRASPWDIKRKAIVSVID